MKKDFTENEPKENKDQALEFVVERDKCTEVSEDMSFEKFNF